LGVGRLFAIPGPLLLEPYERRNLLQHHHARWFSHPQWLLTTVKTKGDGLAFSRFLGEVKF